MLPTSRAAAAAAGVSQYFTGKPCKNGHVAHRYTQSGTCSQCIAACTAALRRDVARRMAPSAGVQAAARRELVVELVEVRVRCYPGDAAQVRDVAAALCLAKYPTLTRDDVQVRAQPTDGAGGTFLYRVRVPSEFVGMLRETAAALLAAHAVDLAPVRASLAERAALLAPPPVAPVPEWRFQ